MQSPRHPFDVTQLGGRVELRFGFGKFLFQAFAVHAA
jgi:hypothetical protein